MERSLAKVILVFMGLFVQVVANGEILSTNNINYGAGETFTQTFSGAIANDHFIADTLDLPSKHKGDFATLTNTAISATAIFNRLPADSSFMIKAYPNPGFGIIHILCQQSTFAQISLTSLAGSEVLKRKIQLTANSLNTCDISGIPNGPYFLSIITDRCKQTMKIVKQ